MAQSGMRLVVVGAAGRMGRTLVRTVMEAQGTMLHGAVEREGAPGLGQDAAMLAGLPASGVLVTADLERALQGADGIIDFTSPQASVQFAHVAAKHGLVHICGTTGMGDAEFRLIDEAGKRATIVRSGNFSLGVNMLAELIRKAAAALDPSWDIEIVEMHHRMKVDAPSGTALMFGEAAASGRQVALAERAVRSREGHTGARKSGDIGFAALRGGTVIGDHTTIFAGNGERLELRHIAEDRGLFANGAIKAALWAHGRAPGVYSMRDVLGLKE